MSRGARTEPAAPARAGAVAPLWVVLWLVIVAGPASAMQEAGEAPTGPEVVEVRFPGAESLDEDRLEAAIETRATRCRSPLFFLFCAVGAGWALERAYLDTAVVAEDVERLETLYELWGYPDAEVTARVVPRGRDEVAVEFAVVEGEPIRVASLEIVGLDLLDPPVDLPEPLPLEPGDVYALPMLDSLREVVVLAFAERGRPYAQVEFGGDVDVQTRSAALVLTVSPGPAVVFGPAVIEPEPPIEESVVRERLAFEPGEPFRISALRESERSLYQLPVVERVIITPQGLEAGDTVVTPRVQVESRQVQAFQVEGTISSTDCLEAAVFWVNRYFLGGPRVFTLGVGFANLLANFFDGDFPCSDTGEGEFADPDYFVQADLRQPWPGHPRTALLLSAFFTRESAPNVYVQRGYGGRIGVAREFRPELTGSVQYAPQRNELKAAEIYFCGTYGVCEPAALDDLTDFKWYAPVEALVIWTPTGVPIQLRRAEPGERWRQWVRAGAEGAAAFTASDYEYVRGIGEAARTRLFGSTFELAGRTRVGILAGEEILPPQVRLYSGGVSTVRGVAQNLLGPKALVTSPELALAEGCELVTLGCPAGTVVDPDDVSPRPTGGDLLLEANLEGRVWVSNTVQFAAFVDFGMLRRDALAVGDAFVVDASESLVTPGIGVRILTGLGPVRIDLGYDPSGARTYPLITRDPETGDLIVLGNVVYDPFEFDDPSGFTEFVRRLQLHVAIGQPF